MSELLLLWDIDGTLLQRASVEHGRAIFQALEEVHGVSEPASLGVSFAGRTDGAIARDLLLASGVPAERVDERAADVREAACRAFDALCPADLSHTVASGMSELLAELDEHPGFHSSLLTGNFEPVARLKLERAGLGARFALGQGAFGSDAERREELPAIARHRAAVLDGRREWPRERTIIIGDTPRDVAAARADGLRCIAVATGSFTVEELREADHVAVNGHEVAGLLRSLA